MNTDSENVEAYTYAKCCNPLHISVWYFALQLGLVREQLDDDRYNKHMHTVSMCIHYRSSGTSHLCALFSLE